MVDHSTLVTTAQTLFPGSQVVSDINYEAFRDTLFRLVREHHGAESDAWRLEFLQRLAYRYANYPTPYGAWGLHLAEVELPQWEARIRKG